MNTSQNSCTIELKRQIHKYTCYEEGIQYSAPSEEGKEVRVRMIRKGYCTWERWRLVKTKLRFERTLWGRSWGESPRRRQSSVNKDAEWGRLGHKHEETSLGGAQGLTRGTIGNYPEKAGWGHTFDCPEPHQDEKLIRHSVDVRWIEVFEKETSQASHKPQALSWLFFFSDLSDSFTCSKNFRVLPMLFNLAFLIK